MGGKVVCFCPETGVFLCAIRHISGVNVCSYKVPKFNCYVFNVRIMLEVVFAVGITVILDISKLPLL